VTPPSGESVTIEGFYNQDFTLSEHPDGWDRLRPKGEPTWTFRYTPTETGVHTWVALLEEGDTITELGSESFVAAKESNNAGFIGVAPNGTHFETSQGAPFYPVGLNIAWAHRKGLFDYERWFDLCESNGVNIARVWMGPLAWPIQRSPTPPDGQFRDPGTGYVKHYLFPEQLDRQPPGEPDPYAGAGKVDLAHAWRYDQLLEMAEASNIKLMLCLHSFNSFRLSQMWPDNPYNQAASGMLKKPGDFFTSEEARRKTKQMLRYLVARYGYSTTIFAWELFNEVDNFEEYDIQTAAPWHREMAEYLKSIDPNKHLVSTSFVGSENAPINSLEAIDFTQTHLYDSPSMPATIAYWNNHMSEAYDKPHLVGEFGLAEKQTVFRGGKFTDPTGRHLESGLWASLASKGAGTALPWYWEYYLEPLDLYTRFKPISVVASRLPWTEQSWSTIDNIQFTLVDDTDQTSGTLLLLPGQGSFSNAPFNQPQKLEVARDGTTTPSTASLSRFIHGIKNHPELHNPLTLEGDFPAGARHTIKIRSVSSHGGAKLVVRVDGDERLHKDSPPLPTPGGPMHQYNGVYSINIPEGEHSVTIDNTGADWFEATYTLESFLDPDAIAMDAFGSQGDIGTAFIYLANPSHRWEYINRGLQPASVPATQMTLNGMNADTYQIEYISTNDGSCESIQHLSANNGVLTIDVPQFHKDIAFLLFPVSPAKGES
ncbi:MAG: cellulase family glycosylhydrolase, partial [Puniceicoccales bacterium]